VSDLILNLKYKQFFLYYIVSKNELLSRFILKKYEKSAHCLTGFKLFEKISSNKILNLYKNKCVSTDPIQNIYTLPCDYKIKDPLKLNCINCIQSNPKQSKVKWVSLNGLI